MDSAKLRKHLQGYFKMPPLSLPKHRLSKTLPHRICLPAMRSGAELPDGHGVCARAGRQPSQAPVDVADANLIRPHAQQHVPAGAAGQAEGRPMTR